MSSYHTKQAKDYISRLKREIHALAPSRETLKTQSRAPEVETIGLDPIDRSTGELVDYERLNPYMEKAGYLPAIAYKLFKEDSK